MARTFSHLLMSVLTILSLLVPFFGRPTVAAAATPSLARIDPSLVPLLATVTSPLQVIVTFEGESAPDALDVALLRQVGITRGLTFQALPMAGVLATPQQINALAGLPGVRSIYRNAPLTLYNADSNALTGVDRVRADGTLTARNGGLPVSGEGVTVLVNDSGVDGLHPDLQFGTHLVENVLGSTNLHAVSDLLPVSYIEGVPNTDTNSGHGTHVAGTVGGTGAASSGLYEGAAPGADLVGYGSGGALLVLDGLGGFDYAITHQFEFDIRVITNSWGSSASDFDPENPINIASKRAYDRNIVVAFAAGNDGPGENTHNPYAKAPWVISVAAGTKQGALADFSSRGTAGVGGTFILDGQSWTWEDRPTITAPGVGIISTRAVAPVSTLGAPDDVVLAPGHIPFYTHMSGTSMATPHVAGVVALMLEANPTLSAAQVKQIIESTATNMPGYEAWEVGAGYLNAYAAVDAASRAAGYGQTLNLRAAFNSSASVTATRQPFVYDYNPLLASSYPFTVPSGVTEVAARVTTGGLAGQTGNPVNVVLIAPDGTEYSSGVSLLFPLTASVGASVASPQPGQWALEIRGLRGDPLNPLAGLAFPEQIAGTLTLKQAGSYAGLSDIAGHPAQSAIQLAVSERLVDSYSDGTYKPNQALTRRELARFLTSGAGVRQFLPLNGAASFSDVSAADRPFVEAVTARGAALKDSTQQADGVVRTTGSTFAPNQAVTRAELAYSLVQSLGLQAQAQERNNQPLTVLYGTQRLPVEDAAQVPAGLRGYVQLALDLNILSANFTLTQGIFDLQPVVHATFRPAVAVTRGEYAVTVTRFYAAYLAQ